MHTCVITCISTGCNCITELPLLRQYFSEFVLNIIFSTATMWLIALLANSMHPAIVLAPPLHPPRPHPASSMPSVPLPVKQPGFELQEWKSDDTPHWEEAEQAWKANLYSAPESIKRKNGAGRWNTTQSNAGTGACVRLTIKRAKRDFPQRRTTGS